MRGQIGLPLRGGSLQGPGEGFRWLRSLATTCRSTASRSASHPAASGACGYYVYSVVKQGSIDFALETDRMAMADPDAYGLPRNVGIRLNDKDIGRA